MSPHSVSAERVEHVSRPFLLLFIGAFALIGLATAWASVHQARTSREASELRHNLEASLTRTEALRRGAHGRLNLLYRQLREPEIDLFDEFQELHFRGAETRNGYLALGVDLQERILVERIKAMDAEIDIEAQKIFILRRDGRDAAIVPRTRIESLTSEIEQLGDELNAMQMEKLRAYHAQAMSVVDRSHFYVACLFVGSVLVLAVAALLMKRRVVIPLQHLVGAAGRIHDGTLDARAPVLRNDEIGHLAREFNRMSNSLSNSYADLEERVKERTRQLEEVQQQLIQTEKMSAVGQLVGGVAHELNNPLTAVLGYADLARSALAKEGVNVARGHLDTILEQGDRCRRIIADLLQFARQHKKQLEPLALNDVIQQALKFRRYELKTSGIELRETYDKREPVVLGDRFKLQQVVLSLLNNATDAIGERPGSETIWARTSVEGGLARLEIRDDGTGIREPERVFEPFYTTKDVGKGTGLGLAVCYGIIQEHGGEVRAENWKDGARFVVSLPLAPERVESVPRVEARATLLAQLDGRVLVVDDEDAIVTLQCGFLEQMGLDVCTARNTQEAIERVKTQAMDLVVCDIRMPGKRDGLGFYRWLERHRPELAERFLFTTGDLVLLERQGSEPLPAPCIRKPFTQTEYSESIERGFNKVGSAP